MLRWKHLQMIPQIMCNQHVLISDTVNGIAEQKNHRKR